MRLPLYLLAILLLPCFTPVNAQMIYFETEPVQFVAGSVINLGGLTLTPSTDFSISNNNLSLLTAVSNSTTTTTISRSLKFQATTSYFSGSLSLDYLDGELNGLTEANLRPNIYNGSSWTFYPSATTDASGNVVSATNLTAIVMNELTLSEQSLALPVRWGAFTLQRKNQSAWVRWETASEQNSADFQIQHSLNGINWQPLGVVAAAGNSSLRNSYSYLHTTPSFGLNYYRLLQRDLDGRSSYSIVRSLLWENIAPLVSIQANPVKHGMLLVNAREKVTVQLRSALGILQGEYQLVPGSTAINTAGLAAGTYLLSTAEGSLRFVVQ